MALNHRQQRRHYRESREILHELSEAELIKRFRLDHEGILHGTNLVRNRLVSPTNRNNPFTPEMESITTLRYLATGKMQQCNSDDLGPSQPSVSIILTQALATPEIVQRFVNFKVQQQELERRKQEFCQVAGFPGFIGVIDGTQLRIIAPKGFEEEYVNRKKPPQC